MQTLCCAFSGALQTGTCPLSGEALTKDDLLAVKGPAKLNPRPASATSIPGLLNLFQTEWDALVSDPAAFNPNLVKVNAATSLLRQDYTD